MADTTIEFEIHFLKGEIKSMHKMGLLVPSSTYERLHKLEKKLARAKRDGNVNITLDVVQKGGSSNESNTSN